MTNILSDINSINTRLVGLPAAISLEEFALELSVLLVEYPSSPVYDLGDRYKYAASKLTHRVVLSIHNELADFISKLDFTTHLKRYLTNDKFSEMLYDAILFEEGLYDINPDINLSDLSFSV